MNKKLGNIVINVKGLTVSEKLSVLGKLVKIGYTKHHYDWKPIRLYECEWFIAESDKHIEWVDSDEYIEEKYPTTKKVNGRDLLKDGIIVSNDGLITAHQAKQAWVDGNLIEFRKIENENWSPITQHHILGVFDDSKYVFRIRNVITILGKEYNKEEAISFIEEYFK